MPYCDDVVTVRVKPEHWNASDVDELVASHGGRLQHQFGLVHAFAMVVPPEQRDFIVRALYDDPRVEFVGLSVKGHVTGIYRHGPNPPMPTNVASGWDGYRGHLFRRLNVFAAWEDTRGATAKPGLAPIGHCDIGTVPSYFDNKTWQFYSVPHGTTSATDCTTTTTGHGFLTGTILYGNRPGYNINHVAHVGVAPDIASIVYVRMAINNDDTSTQQAAALQWAWDHGAKIISFSSGTTSPDPVREAICEAIYNGGGLVVGSAGNEHNADPFYPAYHDYVLNVGGIDQGDNAWGASAQYHNYHFHAGGSFGSAVDVASYSNGLPMGPMGEDWTLWRGQGTSFATPAVAAVCYMIACINPALTGAQIKAILLSTVDKAHRGWWFYGFFTQNAVAAGYPGVGIPDAAKAIAKAKTTLAENAGVVFPYLRIHSPNKTDRFDGDYSSWAWNPGGVREVLNADGTVDVCVEGPVGWEITGFCSSGPVTEVELWIDGVREYIGPPTDPWAGLLLRDEYRNRLWQLRVVARTATGQVATRDYAITANATGALQTELFYLAEQVSAPSITLQTQVVAPTVVARQAAYQVPSISIPLTLAAPAVTRREMAVVHAVAAEMPTRAYIPTVRVRTVGTQIRLGYSAPVALRYFDGADWVPVNVRVGPY